MRTAEMTDAKTYEQELIKFREVFAKNSRGEELELEDVKTLAQDLKEFNKEPVVNVEMVPPDESETCASLKTSEPSWFNWLRQTAPCAPSWDPFSRACDHAFVCKEGSVFLGECVEKDHCLPFHSDKKFESKQTVTIDDEKKTKTVNIAYYDNNEKTTVFNLDNEVEDGIKIEETYTDPQKNTKTIVFDPKGNVVAKKTGAVHGKKQTVVTTDPEGNGLNTEVIDLKDDEINENGDYAESNKSEGNEEGK
jgi:hypothetical protein